MPSHARNCGRRTPGPHRRGTCCGHPREVFADVIADRAAGVIFVHNHPSGKLQPSESDLSIHRQFAEAGKILGIQVLDHVIVTRKGYYSFRESGL